jgi:DNA-binding MarR family transcriptional regulator/N-acetylglutamate synthase-like GNAT family acetyltransferase
MVDQVDVLRSFHRTVTARVGALETEYLGRGRPLGECRLLWEIEPAGTELRALRRRLGLDPAYLSRLVRSLEAQRLVVVSESEADGRVRTVRLSARGRRERQEIDKLSNELVSSILESLDDVERGRLADAAQTVERLLRASQITIDVEDPDSADARWCLEQYYATLAERFEAGYDRSRALPATAEEMSPPRGAFLVARLHGEPVGCGGLKRFDDAPPDIKRMWVAPGLRGLGLGRRLLRELESHARAGGARSVRLETNRSLTEAIALYRSSGYEEVPAFNDEPHAHLWFEKRLPASRSEPGATR